MKIQDDRMILHSLRILKEIDIDMKGVNSTSYSKAKVGKITLVRNPDLAASDSTFHCRIHVNAEMYHK